MKSSYQPSVVLKNARARVLILLKPKWVGRTLIVSSVVSGGLAMFLSTNIPFELFSSDETQPTLVNAALPESSEFAVGALTGDITNENPLLNTGTSAASPISDETEEIEAHPDKSEKPNVKKAKQVAKASKNKKDLQETGPVAVKPDIVTPQVVAKIEGELAKSGTAKFDNTPQFDREAVLNDSDHRINEKFAIPEGMHDRVAFWFDVYTRYDDTKRIIHDSRYPWIVFKVIDVSPIIYAKIPSHRWMRNEKADKLVKEETRKIRAAVQSVAKRKSLENLNEYETLVVDALKKLPGVTQKQARNAIGDVRVQTGQKNFFMDGLEVSPRYLGTMEKIFRDRNLPIELTRIPFVESSFNKHATSKVGASGIWQFMGNTGRKFMLVNNNIDERRSPFKATEAAARLLKENHMILKRSWPLAVTAWNHGPSGIRRAAHAAGSFELGTIVAKYRSRSFDFASSNFYSEFIAALHAERYNAEIFGQIRREAALEIHVLQLPKAYSIGELLRVSKMSKDDFFSLNADLQLASLSTSLPKGFRLHVPVSARAGLERHLAIKVASSDRATL